MSEPTAAIDSFDRKILDVLAVDGRISVTELARRIGLSKSPTQARLKRLEDRGVIRGYRALYDPIRLDRDHVAFVEVKLSDTREAALAAFNAGVLKIVEIEQCHLIAGAFDYLLKVRTAGMTPIHRPMSRCRRSKKRGWPPSPLRRAPKRNCTRHLAPPRKPA